MSLLYLSLCDVLKHDFFITLCKLFHIALSLIVAESLEFCIVALLVVLQLIELMLVMLVILLKLSSLLLTENFILLLHLLALLDKLTLLVR